MLDINREFVSGEVRQLFFSVIDREFKSRYGNILNCFFFWTDFITLLRTPQKQYMNIWSYCFEAVARGLDDVLNNWSKLILKTTKNNFSEIHISGRRP